MQTIWTNLFYQPIYNALIFIINHVTFGDVGFAIIILTILVKLILFPLSKKSIRSQFKMKQIEPLLKKIKEDYPNKEEQSKKTFELYKQYKVNPFSGCLVLLVQLPVIFALYYAFYKGLAQGTDPLYSFVTMPVNLHTMFLGVIDVHGKSIVLALLAGISQFIQGQMMFAKKPKKDPADSDKPKTFQEQMSDSMSVNVRFILPIFIVFISYKISAAVALYWVTSNVFTIIQEWYVKNNLKKEDGIIEVKAIEVK